MTSATRLETIKARVIAAFSPDYLEVLDESDQHIGHAGHGGGGRHFAVIISAPCLKSVPRVEAHRKIYSLFADMIPDQIHALRIVLR